MHSSKGSPSVFSSAAYTWSGSRRGARVLLSRLSRATRVVLFQLSEPINCGFF